MQTCYGSLSEFQQYTEHPLPVIERPETNWVSESILFAHSGSDPFSNVDAMEERKGCFLRTALRPWPDVDYPSLRKRLSGTTCAAYRMLRPSCYLLKHRDYTHPKSFEPKTPWAWETWQQIANMLDPVVSAVFGTPSVYSRQGERTRRLRSISFGRMTWNERSHQRWTHGSPVTIGQSDDWEFVDTQIWVPGPKECERERKRPNLYIQVLNGALTESGPVRFSAIVLLAVACDLPETVRYSVDRAMHDLKHLLRAKLRAYKVRSWSRPFGFMTVDSIMDLDTWLFKVGPRHDQEPSLALFHEEWQVKGSSVGEKSPLHSLTRGATSVCRSRRRR
jgi:hypothetical protein